MSPREISIIRKLCELLSQRRLVSRATCRGQLSELIRPRPPLVWGGTLVAFRVWWGTFLFVSLLIPLIEAIYFNGHGRPLPGGVLNILLFVMTILGGFAIGSGRRFFGMRNRQPAGEQHFLAGVHEIDAEVPDEFAMAVRKSLAAAYCVPVELIDAKDTRNRCRSLSLFTEPLAIELIAPICTLCTFEYTWTQLQAAAEPFRRTRARNVAALVHLLHKEMLAAGLTARVEG